MKKSNLFYALYALIMLALLLLALELGSGLVLKRKDQGADVRSGSRHLYHPYRLYQLNPDYVRPYDTHGLRLHSADGFRSDRPVAKDKAPGVFRIIMMGGSALYGIGAEQPYPRYPTLRNDQLVSSHLESLVNRTLRQAGRPLQVEVINAAVTGYTTFQHLVYFNEVLYEYRPDLVVFMDGHNDFYHYEVYNNWQSAPGGTADLTGHFNARTLWFTAASVVRYLAQYSNFFMALEKFSQRHWPVPAGSQFPQSASPRALPASFPANVGQILDESIFKSYVQFKALGQLYGFDILVFLQPQLALERPERLSESDRELQIITERHENNRRRAEIRPVFPDLFAKRGIDFEDVAEIATDATRSEALYIDYCHLTPKGSEITAGRMLAAVTRRIESRVGATSARPAGN